LPYAAIERRTPATLFRRYRVPIHVRKRISSAPDSLHDNNGTLYHFSIHYSLIILVLDCNVTSYAQKTIFVYGLNGRVHHSLNSRYEGQTVHNAAASGHLQELQFASCALLLPLHFRSFAQFEPSHSYRDFGAIWSKPKYPNFLSLPYPLIRLFIYEYPPLFITPAYHSKSFFFSFLRLAK
jgi:hypothetical protein